MNRAPAPRPRTLTGALALVLSGTLLLAGCGASSAPAVAAGRSSDDLTPNQLHQLLTILEAVNPGMSTDESALVDASLRVCTHIRAHESNATVETLVTEEFANGQYRPSPEEAEAIDMAIAKTFCFD